MANRKPPLQLYQSKVAGLFNLGGAVFLGFLISQIWLMGGFHWILLLMIAGSIFLGIRGILQISNTSPVIIVDEAGIHADTFYSWHHISKISLHKTGIAIQFRLGLELTNGHKAWISLNELSLRGTTAYDEIVERWQAFQQDPSSCPQPKSQSKSHLKSKPNTATSSDSFSDEATEIENNTENANGISTCPQCHAPIEDNPRRCNECGTDLFLE